MRTIHLTDDDLLPDEEMDRLPGTFLYRPHYDRVIRGTTTVLKPDGSVLVVYITDAIPRSVCLEAYATFRDAPLHTTDGRGYAAGGMPHKHRKTVRWRRMQSDVVGFLDRTPRNPYCRMTTLARDHLDTLPTARRLARVVSGVFQRFAPDRWQVQRTFCDRVNPAFIIGGTVFTSITVNRNERTAAHTDAHDYRPGLGVMTVVEGRPFFGGELIFPKYRTAVDMRTGGVCLADVHEWHGNAPMVAKGQTFTRVSFVFYAREHMDRCGTLEEERNRAAAITSTGR
jgi:Oxygenase domain of the 2OGFeDO superfamily